MKILYQKNDKRQWQRAKGKIQLTKSKQLSAESAKRFNIG